MTQRDKSRAFLGFGGNLDQPLTHFRRAREKLAAHPQISVLSSAALYRTPAIGGPENQPDFLNTAVEIETGLAAENLLEICLRIENAAGRSRDVHWGPRTLDIDLLLFANVVMDTTRLTLPHPRLHQRHFALLPLCDLDRRVRHPRLKKTAQELLNLLPPAEGISCLQELW